jgi:hypothetical protein
METLGQTGMIIDPFLALELQLQIMKLFSCLLHQASRELIETFYNIGGIRTMIRFIIIFMDNMNVFVTPKHITELTYSYMTIRQVILMVINDLLLIMNENICRQLLEIGFFTKLIDDWLRSTVVASLRVQNIELNPFIVRQFALEILRCFITVVDVQPHIRQWLDILANEIGDLMHRSLTVKKEVELLLKPGVKKGSIHMKNSAADVMMTVAALDVGELNRHCEVSVPGIHCIEKS